MRHPLLMELTFYCASDPAVRFNDARNRGIEVVRSLLEKLERRVVKVRTIEPSTLSLEHFLDAYAQATDPAICKTQLGRVVSSISVIVIISRSSLLQSVVLIGQLATPERPQFGYPVS